MSDLTHMLVLIGASGIFCIALSKVSEMISNSNLNTVDKFFSSAVLLAFTYMFASFLKYTNLVYLILTDLLQSILVGTLITVMLLIKNNELTVTVSFTVLLVNYLLL